MYSIQDATFVRVGNRFGETCAEVEVNLAGYNQPVTVLLQQKNGAISLFKIVQNNEDQTIDWYDNDLHQAHYQVTSQVLDSARTSTITDETNISNTSHSSSEPNPSNSPSPSHASSPFNEMEAESGKEVFVAQLLNYSDIKEKINQLM